MYRVRLASVALALLLSACGATELGQTIVATSPGTLTPGTQRVLAIIADDNQDLVGGPDRPMRAVLVADPDSGGSPLDTAETEWVWAIPDVRGFYSATLDFPEPGVFWIRLESDGGTTAAGTVQVVETTDVPRPGDPAPASDTRTMRDHSLAEITTDPEPDPAFYDTTVAEAVTSGRPAVIVFATPAFCQTAACGPTLDVVKSVAEEHPDVEFVHVEVFENIDDPRGELLVVPAVEEWGLTTEPWAFVVDADGIVRAAFEGAVAGFEIERALSGLS